MMGKDYNHLLQILVSPESYIASFRERASCVNEGFAD